ncbi:MAG: hypothetical protein ACLPSW_33400 [Roseiarcus sp.]
MLGLFASRICGSADIYTKSGKGPESSINFVTCHDGFTLNDLVSYNQKHNEDNGENNRDGMNENLSWNCGAEGPVKDPTIEALRCRQIKNFITLTLLAVGTPMLLMGDEMRRTQLGNNNAYCQDSQTSWLDWNLLQRHADIHRFVKMLVAFRARREVAIEDTRLTLNQLLERARLDWHGVTLHRPDWSDDSHSIAFTLRSLRRRFTIHGMLNAYWEPLTFELPLPSEQASGGWRRWLDTSLPPPQDIVTWEEAPIVSGHTYVVGPRSLAFLIEQTL